MTKKKDVGNVALDKPVTDLSLNAATGDKPVIRTHTAGPWTWFNYPDGRKLLCAENRAVIHCPDAPFGIEPADAHLIAAAPDLLTVAHAAYHALKSYQYGNGAPDLAEATCGPLLNAIAKAEGRS